jgi:predicted AAA+ superfamily ATPase
LGSVRKAYCVIGMRRSGKSTFLHQCRADLLHAGRSPESLLYFDFEDERLGDLEVSDLAMIPDLHARLYPGIMEGPVTFFFDEIQRVPDWERFARRLHDAGRVDLFLSGSSARLLSREIATAMRGRSWELVVQPFSFVEYLHHHGVPGPGRPEVPTEGEAALMDHHFLTWLQCGGFPEAQSLGQAEARSLLQSYVDSVMLRDVIERHRVTSVVVLRQLVRRLLTAPCGRFTVAKFHADLKSRQIASSRDTLHDLLAHLEDAFLVSAVPIATES